ncbi:MAG: hypothetical protein HYT75_02045 [Deltaproteobacteria bacterium]|nr:hypothetical protein [Deltaproteobacteria bacterium]
MTTINQVTVRSAEEPVRRERLPIEESLRGVPSLSRGDEAISLATSDKYSDTPFLGAPTGAVMQSLASPRGFIPSPLLPLSMLIFAAAPKPNKAAPAAAAPKKGMLDLFAEGQDLEKEGDWLKKNRNSAGAARKYKAAAEKFEAAGVKPAHARALIKWASSYEEALRERNIKIKWAAPESIYQQAASAFRESLQQKRDKKGLETAKELLLFAIALEGSGQNSWEEAQKVYEESAMLFFELDDPAGARLAASDALIIAEKRNDPEGRISLLILKGDASLALGEYRAAAESYSKSQGIGSQLSPVPDAARETPLLASLVERLGLAEGLEPLGAKGVGVFKNLAAESEYFRKLSSAEQIGAVREIVKEWEAIRPDMTEIGKAFIRAHSPVAKKGAALRHEGEQLMSKGTYKEAEEKFRLAAPKYHVARLYDREAEARHLQLEALDAIVGRQDKEFRADIVAQEISAWNSAADEANGIEKAKFLEKKAYALVAAGKVRDAIKIISVAHSVNVREGTPGLEANARMHENFGKLLYEKSRFRLAVHEFETSAQARYMLKQFTRAARLYGQIGDYIGQHGVRGKGAVYYYDLAIAAATQGRDGELSWRYSRKKIDALLATDGFVEAAELADELLKRSTKSDRMETALDLRREAVRRILKSHVKNPMTDRESIDGAWKIYSLFSKRVDFSRLSERDQWRVLNGFAEDWLRVSHDEKDNFVDIVDFAEQYYEAATTGAVAEGVEARKAKSGRERKEGREGKEGRAETDRAEGRPVK